MKPFYQDEWVTHYCSDALRVLAELPDESVDLLATDPPYGIGFMGKDWDKALPNKQIWAECLRVLRSGAFAFVMSIPRSDCQARMVIALQDAGFNVGFTPIYWAYASGFPKAQNIGKAVDKRLGAKRKRVKVPEAARGSPDYGEYSGEIDSSVAITPQAKAPDGSYGGFQPKPAVEVVIVCMKPLSEKTFVDQALKNGKGITWLDDGRIPYESEDKPDGGYGDMGIGIGKPLEHQKYTKRKPREEGTVFKESGFKAENNIIASASPRGRFPANLLVSDDVLNDGKDYRGMHFQVSGYHKGSEMFGGGYIDGSSTDIHGSFSRYFDLDKWAQKTFPFLIVPKASKREKNKGLDKSREFSATMGDGIGGREHNPEQPSSHVKNVHSTVKPLKLMSYLITLGSREGDIVLDPFLGSGTTALASKLLNRKCIGIEIEEKYCEIAAKRCSQSVMRLEL